MADFSLAALSGTTPLEFAQIVKKSSDKDINSVMEGSDRQPILAQVFQQFPLMFQPDKAQGVESRINFRITGGPDGGSDTYAVVIKDGACTVQESPQADPTVSLMMGPADFFKILTGTGNPVMMAMTGKLKVRGDLALAQSFSKFFATPKA